jgi:hypothetical protein
MCLHIKTAGFMPSSSHTFTSRFLGRLWNHREVDFFVDQLEKTIQFFAGLENETDGASGGDDGFVPFI